MNISFIGALVVMIALTAFTFIILRASAADTGNKIRDNVIKQLQAYDSLIQKKNYELKAIQKQLDEAQSKMPHRFASAVKNSRAAGGFLLPDRIDSRNPAFFDDYRRIKGKIDCSVDEALHEICGFRAGQDFRHKGELRERNLLLDGLLDKFNFENVYRLSVLHPDEQLEVVGEMLSEDGNTLFAEFMDQRTEFNGLSFYQWLYMQKKICDDTIRVKAAEMDESQLNIPDEELIREYDKNMCEGFQIVIGNKLYDYGIRKYELI
jgi:hypothetical protein